MKKDYFLLCFLTLFGQGIYAQFLPATIQEMTYPIPQNYCLRAMGLNCYSYGNVHFAPDNTDDDLFIYCWTGAGSSLVSYIGWKRVLAGTNIIIDQGFTPVQGGNSKGIDVAFVKYGEDIFVIAGYYQYGFGHVLDYYKWDVNNLIFQQTAILSQSSIYSPVQLDAHKLYGYAVTWADAGQVHVRAGRTDMGPLLACDAVLNLGYSCHNPDIAIGHGGSVGSGLTLHFINATSNDQKIIESTLPFDDVQLNCQSLMTPNIEDIISGSGFSYPRIDCPDHFNTDDWSYIVSDVNNNVTAGVMAYAVAPAPKHYILNNGSLGNLNITGSYTYRFDYSALVLAYDNTGKSVYYCWSTDYNSEGYIGLKLHNNGTLYNYLYWLMMQQPQYASPIYSIALSGQNDVSPDLYSVFAIVNSSGYAIDYKHIPWYLQSFRPTKIDNVVKGFISIAPNPFTTGFQLNNVKDAGGIYFVSISDISGRIIKQLKGNLNKINNQLISEGDELIPGMYFVRVEYKDSNKMFKIVRK